MKLPHRRTARVTTGMLSSALALLLIPGSALAQQASDLPRLEESDCATEALTQAGAECYTLHVQEDWDDPNDNTVALPVGVLEPEAGEAPATPVFFFPGGPGYSILGASDLIAQYRKDVGDRTLVLLDHRGMNHSDPALKCPAYADVSPYHDLIFTPGVSGAIGVGERRQSVTDVVEDCYAKLVDEGIDVAEYNSHTIARDVEALREALGYGPIDLYGRSTGGGTALAYQKYFPDSVRATVVVSPWFTNLRNRAPIDEFHTLKQKYTDVLGMCVRQSDECQAMLPDWFLTVERARRALDARPYVRTVEADDGTRETLYLDGVALLHTLYLYLPVEYYKLPHLLTNIRNGDYSGLDEFFRVDQWQPKTTAPRYALGYFLAHVCNDMGANRVSAADSTDMIRREPAIMGFEPQWVCGWWGTDGDVPRQHSWRNTSEKPVLSIHGQMDPCCGLRWGQHLAETMENVQYVELQNTGHTPDTECGSKMMASFLDAPDEPVDTACANDIPLEPWQLE